MNTAKIKDLLVERELLVPVIVLVLGAVVLSLFYGYGNRMHHRQLRLLRGDVAATTKKLDGYSNFDSFASGIREQQEIIVKTATTMGLNMNSTAIPDVLEDISRICKDLSINLDHIAPVKEDKGQVWSIAFVADYRRIDRFLALIEKFYRVESLTISRADGNGGNRVDIIISNILQRELDTRDASKGSTAPDDFFDLFGKLSATMGKIASTGGGVHHASEDVNDPFRAAGDASAQSNKPRPITKPVVANSPDVTIEAIYWDPETPAVVVDGRALKEGDSAQDIRIIKINENTVEVQWHSRNFILKPKGK